MLVRTEVSSLLRMSYSWRSVVVRSIIQGTCLPVIRDPPLERAAGETIFVVLVADHLIVVDFIGRSWRWREAGESATLLPFQLIQFILNAHDHLGRPQLLIVSLGGERLLFCHGSTPIPRWHGIIPILFGGRHEIFGGSSQNRVGLNHVAVVHFVFYLNNIKYKLKLIEIYLL